MKNVTISPYKEVATWARIRAAELGTSVSRLVGGMLNEKNARTKKTYKTSMQQYLSRSHGLIKETGNSPAVRNSMSVRIFVDINVLVYSRDA